MQLILRWTRFNRYTLAALAGLVDERLPEIPVALAAAPAEVEALAQGARTLVAYSFLSPQAPEALAEISRLKARLGERIVVLAGGPHATACAGEVLEAGADLVFRGEAEESLVSELAALLEGRGAPPGTIVDPLPLGPLDRYPPFALGRGLFAPIELRRGCAGRCAFCQTPRLAAALRERSPEGVLEHGRRMRAKGCRRIHFIAPDALSYGARAGRPDPDLLERFLSSLAATGLEVVFGTFPSEVAPERLARCPEAAAVLRRHVANRRLVIGGQSGSEEVLRRLGRTHTVADIAAAAAVARAAGFEPLVDILFGTPDETRAEREATLALMQRLHREHGARINLHSFLPLPGTPLAGARPARIEPDLLAALGRLTARGVAGGGFFSQLRNRASAVGGSRGAD